MPFKVGDKVKVVQNVSGDFIGEIGTVARVGRVNVFGVPLIDVQLKDIDDTNCFYLSELEVIEEGDENDKV